MKLIVTGCSGYVGASLVPALLAQGHRVVGIDRVPPAAFGNGFDFIQCDLSSPGGALDAPVLQGAQAVVHLAAARGDWAISKAEYWRDNRDATAGLLAAPWAASVPVWVFLSSVSVYGPAEVPLAETAPTGPIGPYGESKLASEQLFKDFIARHRLQGCSIRPSAVFSPGHPSNTNVYKLIESLRGFPVPLIGGGVNRKTLTYLPNLVDLISWALQRMQAGQLPHDTYNYVEEPVQTVFELITTLKAAGITPARAVRIPLGLAVAASYPVYAFAKLLGVDLRITPERVHKFAASTWYDAARVRADGFMPRVSLLEALNATAQWHIATKP